ARRVQERAKPVHECRAVHSWQGLRCGFLQPCAQVGRWIPASRRGSEAARAVWHDRRQDFVRAGVLVAAPGKRIGRTHRTSCHPSGSTAMNSTGTGSHCANAAGATGARVRGPVATPSPAPLEPRMRLFLASLACCALMLAGCDDVLTDAAEAESEPADRAEAAAPSRIAVSMPARVVRAAPAPTATPAAQPAPARAAPRATAVERVTGGPGPRRRVIEPDPPFVSTPVASFDSPWAMTFLPDGRALVTEKGGA